MLVEEMVPILKKQVPKAYGPLPALTAACANSRYRLSRQPAPRPRMRQWGGVRDTRHGERHGNPIQRGDHFGMGDRIADR